ncbi:MAG: hypothetical protein GVY12_09800, partial [Bacteroidetes bacterium]|jgi:tetratricopeptide (TPR) repeat protein|nr:hypothetical protein [Bacteroidota bacterium]
MNERSWQASVDRMAAKDLSIAARSYHALWWLAYGELQQGRYEAARATLGIAADALRQDDAPTHRHHFVRMRAAYLTDTQRWDDPVLDVAVDRSQLGLRDAAVDHFITGWHAVQQQDLTAAQETLESLQAQIATQNEPGAAPEIMALELEALILQAYDRPEEAVALMERATARAEAQSLTYGPPIPVKPAHELFGDLLMALDRPAEAQVQYHRALDRAPKRARSLLGLARAATAAGDMATADEAAATLRAIWDAADPALHDQLQATLSARTE